MLSRRQLELFDALSFDCYGTLIDWEAGIVAALSPVLLAHGIQRSEREILELYARAESDAESGEYKPYREVLREVVRRFGRAWGFSPTAAEQERLADSLPEWAPFPDTVEALRTLARRYRLAVVSNVDTDLFEATARRLEVPFDCVITAAQARAYKPSARPFVAMLESLSLSPNRVLHLAQSLHHDIVPATTLGLSTVWVNRRAGRDGFGATPPAEAAAHLEVRDLAGFVAHLL